MVIFSILGKNLNQFRANNCCYAKKIMLNDAFLKIYVDPSSFGRFLPLLHKHRRPGEHNSASKSLAEIRGWKFGFLFFFLSHFLVVFGTSCSKPCPLTTVLQHAGEQPCQPLCAADHSKVSLKAQLSYHHGVRAIVPNFRTWHSFASNLCLNMYFFDLISHAASLMWWCQHTPKTAGLVFSLSFTSP